MFTFIQKLVESSIWSQRNLKHQQWFGEIMMEEKFQNQSQA